MVAFVAAVFVALGLSAVNTSVADVPGAPEVTGVLQDWNVESRYMVVEGVRYEFGTGFVVLTEGGQPLPEEAIDAGVQVRFWSEKGIVEAVIVVTDGERQ